MFESTERQWNAERIDGDEYRRRLPTGVAYRNWRQYRKSPDFTGTRFVSPYDFVAHTPYPLDREGHGTSVTGTLAEALNQFTGRPA